jgi:hypothetical protein
MMQYCTIKSLGHLCEISGSRGGKYDDDCLLDVAPCSLVEVNQRLRGTCCRHHHTDETEMTSQTSVNFYQTTE